MTFRDALIAEFRRWKDAGKTPSPFAFYCGLSDLIGSDYTNRKKASLLLRVDRKISLIEAFLLHGCPPESWDDSPVYGAVADLLGRAAFRSLVAILRHADDPERFPDPELKERETTASVKREPPAERKAPLEKNAPPVQRERSEPPKNETAYRKPATAPPPQPAVVYRAPEKAADEPKTYLTAPSYASGGGVPVWVFVLVGVVLALGIVAAILFGNWTVRQWIIGVFGGAAAVGIAVAVAFIISEINWEEPYMMLAYVLPVFLVANIVLYLIFRQNDRIIFGCLSVWLTGANAVGAFLCFDDVEEEYGWAHVVEAAITVVSAVLLLFLLR